MAKKAKVYKYNLKATLSAMEYKNTKYFSNMTEEEQKAVPPFVVQRQMTATTNSFQVFMINELVNRFTFSLGKHKELLFDLMTICSAGDVKYLKIANPLKKKATKMPEMQSIIMEYFGYSSSTAIDAIKIISDEDIIEIAEELGTSKETIRDIKKELKARK